MIEKALKLHELTRDPLFLDAIRALADRNTSPAVRKTVESFVGIQYEAYLLLFQNGGNPSKYGEDE